MRILIDTNILIDLEDNKILDQEFSLLYNKAIINGCQILYHKACIEDIERDKNDERKKIVLSKLSKYSILENPAQLEEDFSKNIGESKINDRIDNIQLFQVKKGYVELFVTNDKEIKKKAKKIGLEKLVLNSKEALTFIDEKYTLTIPSHPVLDHISVRLLEEDFDSDFFTSLKSDYDPEAFMNWIRKCAKLDRKCYTFRIEKELSALLIYNTEKPKDHQIDGVFEDAIKICTLKVADDALGLKLGELFLNKMFELSIIQNVNFLYVTTYEKQAALIHLLEKFGFSKIKEFNNYTGTQERVYLKRLNKKDQANIDGTQLHPFFRDNVNKYVVPIQPKYYKSLFKDGNLRVQTLFDKDDYGLSEVQGNTIIKAYISKSPRLDLVSGDLLFFYSSKTYKSIEPVGVLIEHYRVEKFEDLWEKVKSKTVYSRSELEKMLADSKYLTISIFRLVQYLNPPVKTKDINTLESYSNKFQTITKLTESDYNKIKTAHINESFIVD